MYSDIAKYVVHIDNDRDKEIMITNFDFKVPHMLTLKSHETGKYPEKFDIYEARGCTKETYAEFLIRMREKFCENTIG